MAGDLCWILTVFSLFLSDNACLVKSVNPPSSSSSPSSSSFIFCFVYSNGATATLGVAILWLPSDEEELKSDCISFDVSVRLLPN